MKEYDIVVVGSGAGLMVLEEALNQGLRCAMVEKSKFGGTCLTKGCIPSKMLVYPADLIREIEGAGRVGINAGKPRADWDAISKRMWEQIDFHKQIENSLDNIPNLTLYKGAGAFIGPDTMEIDYGGKKPAERIRGERFIVAAGARSFIPEIGGIFEAGFITSESFFADAFPKTLWKSLAIIGGGAISAEFAHIFSAFGTKVTVVERGDRILGTEEPEISQFVTKQLEKNGVDIMTDSTSVLARREGDIKYLTVENTRTGESITVECDEILIAAGLTSNADLLAIDRAGVSVDGRGYIITDPYLRTSAKNIWAIGDINGKYQFRHKANHEAQVLIENLFGDGEEREVAYDAVPSTIFTHPQAAHVGMGEKELKEKGIPYHVAKNYYSEVVGGRAMGYKAGDGDDGFVKMLVGEDKKVLGVHIVGPQASVLLQPFVYLMNAGYKCAKKRQRSDIHNEIGTLRIMCPHVGTYVPINDAMVIHPSLNELTAWAFEKLDHNK